MKVNQILQYIHNFAPHNLSNPVFTIILSGDYIQSLVMISQY